jgi:hypothetical protein
LAIASGCGEAASFQRSDKGDLIEYLSNASTRPPAFQLLLLTQYSSRVEIPVFHLNLESPLPSRPVAHRKGSAFSPNDNRWIWIQTHQEITILVMDSDWFIKRGE